MRRVISALIAVLISCVGLVVVPTSVAAPVSSAVPAVSQVVKAPTVALPHDSGECTHGCWSSPHVCIIIATTWGPIQTMWADWWNASNSVVAEFRSPGAGCADYPGSRTWIFSAFNDPSYNNCWKWQGTTRAADGHWNNTIVTYFNWGIPSCRTNQTEINHRTGAAIGWIGGTPIWESTEDPWMHSINNMTEWSIANIGYVSTFSGSWWQAIYGVMT
jgi:hypothetical protein